MSKSDQYKSIKTFLESNFRHFNARTIILAAEEYIKQINNNNKFIITMAGAMSTAEIGISLAEMIRKDKVHLICCTAANLEEDIFNLVAHKEYKHIENWRALTSKDEEDLYQDGFNRVTDTCIPEELAMRKIEKHILKIW